MKRNTPDHWKMDDLVNILDIGLAQAVGHMELLFHLTAKQAMHGNIGKISNATIAKKCGWAGDPDTFINALIKSKWLDACSHERLIVHDWHEHCDDATKKAVARSGIDFSRPKTPMPDNGGQSLPPLDTQADKNCLPSLAKPSPALPSLALPSRETQTGEGEPQQTSQDHFAGRPPQALRQPEKPDIPNLDPVHDFDPIVAEKAKLCYEKYHMRRWGGLPDYWDDGVRRDVREIAGAIEAYGDTGYDRLLKYVESPLPAGHTRFIKVWQVLRFLNLDVGDRVQPDSETAKQAEDAKLLAYIQKKKRGTG